MPGALEPIEPSPFVANKNRAVAGGLPASSGAELGNALRNRIAPPPADLPVITSRTDPAKVVWTFSGYDFLTDDPTAPAPDTVNPKLWRQGQLTAIAGLFRVTNEGDARQIYQVRGYDLSNMTIIDGDTGPVVIDPLVSFETAEAALSLYRTQTGDQRPVSALIYTHSHVDHFGGSRGLFGGAEAPSTLPVYAPTGFLEHAISENVYAGPAMARRAEYMYAAGLGKGPQGQVGTGLGLTSSTGEVTLIPPTHSVGEGPATPREEWSDDYVIPWRKGLYARKIDGVTMIFQLTPGTEAPAEMNFYFPEIRTLCMAENATHNLHNILSLRGAQVRDAHAWSTYLTEAIQAFGPYTDIEFASHHWPRWGNAEILEYLGNQRDMYGYLNDQALRLINAGYTGIEIAEKLQELPPKLADLWYTQGFYGSLSHNFKAVYQRYMGWFDGNPAHLWNLPPTEAGVKYLEAMGGPEAVVDIARRAVESAEPDYRWATELLNHVIFASGDPDGYRVPPEVLQQAKALQAEVMTQLGYGAENGPWRNFYLSGADELRMGHAQKPQVSGASDLVHSVTLEQFFTSMAKSVDGPRAGAEQTGPIVLRWTVTHGGQGSGTKPEQPPARVPETCTTTLRNGVLVYVAGEDVMADLSGNGTKVTEARISLSREMLDELVLAGPRFTEHFDNAVGHGITVEGDLSAPDTVFGYLTFPDVVFPIVTPRPSKSGN
ncbi:alkyl sulfatase dimerization domain-containing protein [Streptomyces sp. NPDC037389]|uniref:alkyl/aryl-sulfatase n=1 Tax=Streptomyces sp. NPDC037389 TaxID=3155369 RepID=UPI0033F6FE31